MDPGLLGRLLLVLGLLIAAVGGFLMLGGRIPFGQLPGDINTGSFSFPVTSCLLASLVLSGVVTLVLNIFFRQ